MTYPPQQPYGQQPDPYGQGQQPGGYQTPSGGYPQQAGQYGGYNPTAPYPDPNQQQYGYPGGQYPGGYGGPPPPPQKKNTGMIVAVVSIVVLLLAGVGITGFVAPGFFLSADKKNSASGSGTTSSSPAPEDSGADQFIDDLVKAADDKDTGSLTSYKCSDAESNVQRAIDDIDDISAAKLKDTKETSDDEVTAVLDITVNGEQEEYDATVVKDGKDWCWQDIARSGGSGGLPTGAPTGDPTSPSEPPTGGGGGSGGDGEEFVQGFLDAVNGGKAADAKGMLCDDSTSQGDIDKAVQGKANLQMDPSGAESQPEYLGVDLKGTLNGAPTSAARTSAFLEDGGWCIFTFYAF